MATATRPNQSSIRLRLGGFELPGEDPIARLNEREEARAAGLGAWLAREDDGPTALGSGAARRESLADCFDDDEEEDSDEAIVMGEVYELLYGLEEDDERAPAELQPVSTTIRIQVGAPQGSANRQPIDETDDDEPSSESTQFWVARTRLFMMFDLAQFDPSLPLDDLFVPEDTSAPRSSDRVTSLRADQIAALSAHDIAAVTPEQVRAMTSAQMTGMRPDLIGKLRPDCVAVLSTSQFDALAPDQLRSLTVRQLRAMRPEQLLGLRVDQLMVFTEEQAQSFSLEQISMLRMAQLEALRPDLAATEDEVTAQEVDAAWIAFEMHDDEDAPIGDHIGGPVLNRRVR